jgi:hypothetical protein
VARRTLVNFKQNRPLATLTWVNGRLADFAGGGGTVDLDGSTTPSRVFWSYPFDRALSLAVGSFQVIDSALATKGVVIADGSRFVREINRSYYCANAYEYPAEIGRLPDGRPVLLHCPYNYNQLVVEELETGEQLAAASKDAADVFHSRLRLSPSGRYLL